jgi:heme exporter protein CcmD
MTSIDHFGFILTAYLAGLVVVGAMIVLTVADYASLKRQLARLNARTGAKSDQL